MGFISTAETVGDKGLRFYSLHSVKLTSSHLLAKKKNGHIVMIALLFSFCTFTRGRETKQTWAKVENLDEISSIHLRI